MSESSNGVTDTVTEPTPEPDDYRYRPDASIEKVRAQIESSLREIVSVAAVQVGNFVHLTWADREKGTAVMYGHLVDADECLELAAAHLGMLKNSVAYRLRIEDDTNGPDLPF